MSAMDQTATDQQFAPDSIHLTDLTPLTTRQLEVALDHIRLSPADAGTLELIVQRPAVGERVVLDEAELNQEEGLAGDTWNQRGSKRTDDGGPHPDMQLNIMNARILALIAQRPDRMPLAGDQLEALRDAQDRLRPAQEKEAVLRHQAGDVVQHLGLGVRIEVDQDVAAIDHVEAATCRALWKQEAEAQPYSPDDTLEALLTRVNEILKATAFGAIDKQRLQEAMDRLLSCLARSESRAMDSIPFASASGLSGSTRSPPPVFSMISE